MPFILTKYHSLHSEKEYLCILLLCALRCPHLLYVLNSASPFAYLQASLMIASTVHAYRHLSNVTCTQRLQCLPIVYLILADLCGRSSYLVSERQDRSGIFPVFSAPSVWRANHLIILPLGADTTSNDVKYSFLACQSLWVHCLYTSHSIEHHTALVSSP